jgi:hypothetical protein
MGQICAAGIATLAEILDFEGVWSRDLIELFLPVAIEIEVDRVDVIRRGTLGALATTLTKNGGKMFDARMSDVRAMVRRFQRASRGLPPEKGDTTADQFMGIMRRLGWKGDVKGLKPGKPKRAKDRFGR